ncbi:MAG: hypothetical protein QOH21_2323, partial [Acidobacteriota bacterium]|nr:hypothetical protein [Acidobacteriota bacterium]
MKKHVLILFSMALALSACVQS